MVVTGERVVVFGVAVGRRIEVREESGVDTITSTRLVRLHLLPSSHRALRATRRALTSLHVLPQVNPLHNHSHLQLTHRPMIYFLHQLGDPVFVGAVSQRTARKQLRQIESVLYMRDGRTVVVHGPAVMFAERRGYHRRNLFKEDVPWGFATYWTNHSGSSELYLLGQLLVGLQVFREPTSVIPPRKISIKRADHKVMPSFTLKLGDVADFRKEKAEFPTRTRAPKRGHVS